MKFSTNFLLLLNLSRADELDRYGRPPSVLANKWAKEQLDHLISFNELEIENYMDFEGFEFRHDYVELMNSFADLYPSSSGRIRSLGPNAGKLAPEDKHFMMKFLQLKYSIIYLQKRKVFGKYCFYGCWCLPHGAADIGVGHGNPVDIVDQSCREFATCHNCLYNTVYGRGCEASFEDKYRVTGRIEVATGKKYLMCMDPPRSCNRMRCECDKQLAEKLQEHEDKWNINHHRRWGANPFDSEQRCLTTAQTLAQGGPSSFSSQPGVFSSKEPEIESLNEISLSQRNSFKEAQKLSQQPSIIYGEIIGCCGASPNFHVFRKGQKCCPDGEIVDINALC